MRFLTRFFRKTQHSQIIITRTSRKVAMQPHEAVILGLGCRFPESTSALNLWENLFCGHDLLTAGWFGTPLWSLRRA